MSKTTASAMGLGGAFRIINLLFTHFTDREIDVPGT